MAFNRKKNGFSSKKKKNEDSKSGFYQRKSRDFFNKKNELSPKKNQYFIIYKPYGMLSQFSGEKEDITLKNLMDFERDIYPVGRLDKDSEGLLILTNDKKINHQLLNPKNAHHRTYWVQVEGILTKNAIQQLEEGVKISIKGKKHNTLPAKAQILPSAPSLPPRTPPIRFRKNIPTSWLQLTLTEGKNRQVRKMTAAVGLPTLRLVRVAIEKINLGDMKVGEVREMNKNEIYRRLF